MFLKKKEIQLLIALILGVAVLLLPRPEGKKFRITGDESRAFLGHISEWFDMIPAEKGKSPGYIVEAKEPGLPESTAAFLKQKAGDLNMQGIKIDHVDGLSPKAMRFLAVLVVLLFLFILEPIPLEITAIGIAVLLTVMGIGNVKEIWASYMHPVVVFIMCCLIFAISLEKAGLTKRLGFFIIRKAGNSVVRFTFIISIGLGLSSAFMHDAAATARR